MGCWWPSTVCFAGDGHIDGLGGEAGVHGLGLQTGLGLGQALLDGGADGVGQLPHNGALLGGELAHLLEHGGQLALLAQKLNPQRFQLLRVCGGVQHGQRRLADMFQLVFHACTSLLQR